MRIYSQEKAICRRCGNEFERTHTDDEYVCEKCREKEEDDEDDEEDD